MLFIITKKEDKIISGALKKYIGQLQNGKYSVTIKRWRPTRSNAQNNYYWMYLKIVSDDSGHTSDELHEYFKRKFLKAERKTILGEEIRLPGSSTNLNKLEFGEYIIKIEELTGILAPNPDDYFNATLQKKI